MCSQCNNCYIFPGMGLATVSCCFKKIPDILFLKAADVSITLWFDDELCDKLARCFCK